MPSISYVIRRWKIPKMIIDYPSNNPKVTMEYLFCTNNLLTKAFKNFKTDNVCNTFWEKFYLPLSLFIWGGAGQPYLSGVLCRDLACISVHMRTKSAHLPEISLEGNRISPRWDEITQNERVSPSFQPTHVCVTISFFRRNKTTETF